MSQQPVGEPLYVVVNGPPGSGKTTLGQEIASKLGLPFLSKDVIKEAPMDKCKVPDVEASRRLGRAAMTVLMAEARDSTVGAVIEANFKRSLALSDMGQLQSHVVEVFCRCPRELCFARYRQRSSDRHPGHFDADRSHADLWDDQMAYPVAGGWPVIEVNTSEPADMSSLMKAVRSS